jgi:hypothetical protein
VRYCGGALRDEGKGDVPRMTWFQRLRIRSMMWFYQWVSERAR